MNPPNPPASSGMTCLKLGIACCAVTLLLGLLAVVGVVRLFQSGSHILTAARAEADRFLGALEQKDYARAYALMSREGKTATSAEKLKEIMGMIETTRGAARTHTPIMSFQINTYNGVTQVRLQYNERFAKGDTTVQLVMISEEGGCVCFGSTSSCKAV